jgi:formylglycine-generating enzyme required for sulfatase activity
MAAYPWGDNSRLANGKHMANAKYSRGIYMEDKGAVTREVTAYDPNKYKLYNMAGNVAEWTASAHSNSANSKTHDFNPDFSYMAKQSDPKGLRRKVVKGGSWKDISYFLQCGVRTYEYQDEARSYIGFRCVRSCVTLTVTDEEANQ